MERKYTKEIVRDTVDANNKVLGTIVRVELTTAKQEIVAAMKTGFRETATHTKRVEQKLDKITEDHEERIGHLELAHKN